MACRSFQKIIRGLPYRRQRQKVKRCFSLLVACYRVSSCFRYVVRDFTYNSAAFKNKLEERARLNEEKNKQEVKAIDAEVGLIWFVFPQSFLSRVCLASFSDACIAWIHIKAMRYLFFRFWKRKGQKNALFKFKTPTRLCRSEYSLRQFYGMAYLPTFLLFL